MANVNFDIREITEGMKAMNALKTDIQSLLQFFLPYLSDWAQTEVNKATKNGDDSFKKGSRVLLDFAGNNAHLVFRCKVDSDICLDLALIFQDYLGDEAFIMTASRHQESTHNFDQKFLVEGLSKHDVVPCFDSMQQLLVKLSERYPDEIANEVAPFLEAASRKK